MSKLEDIKAQIEQLPAEEVAEIFHWLSRKNGESWDREIEADEKAGRLDFLIREARRKRPKAPS